MIVGGEELRRLAEQMHIPVDQVQPSSIDLRLAGQLLEIPSDPAVAERMVLRYPRPVEFLVPIEKRYIAEDIPPEWKRLGILDGAHYYEIPFEHEFTLLPGMFYLGATIERVRVPKGMRAIGAMRSTPARHGITHSTALYVDPCFEGQLTLEFTTAMPSIVKIGMRFIQVEFAKVNGADCYQGKYHRQSGLTVPRPERQF